MPSRHQGTSVPNIAGEIISSRAKYVFLVVVWITLVLVIAVFGTVSSVTLRTTPQIVIPTLMQGLSVNLLLVCWTDSGIPLALGWETCSLP